MKKIITLKCINLNGVLLGNSSPDQIGSMIQL